jgi:hypothetical protein
VAISHFLKAQQPKDKNKIYSLHEPDVYVIAKGKDHKQECLRVVLWLVVLGF